MFGFGWFWGEQPGPSIKGRYSAISGRWRERARRVRWRRARRDEDRDRADWRPASRLFFFDTFTAFSCCIVDRSCGWFS